MQEKASEKGFLVVFLDKIFRILNDKNLPNPIVAFL